MSRRELELWCLSRILHWPYDDEWTLSALDPAWFTQPSLRTIARVICELRDRGRLIHQRRVRWMLRVHERDLGGDLVAHWWAAWKTCAIGNAGKAFTALANGSTPW